MNFDRPDPKTSNPEQWIRDEVERQKANRGARARTKKRQRRNPPTTASGIVKRDKPCRECGKPMPPNKRRKGLCIACYFRARRAAQRAAADE
jgi:hypothetical protein